MNRKKGFTLVELLAVIVILAILLAMFVPSLLNSVKNKKEEALNKMYDLIELSVRNYVMDYDLDTPTIIKLEDLCKTSYIDCPIINPETEEELNGYVFVGNDYYYSEEESIKLTVDSDGATLNQTFSDSYAPGTVIELQDASKESYEFLGWEVVEGNSIIKDNKLTIGTTSTVIKPKLVRYLNNYISYLYNNENLRTLNGVIEDNTDDKNIRYAGANDDVNNKVYFNCAPTDGTNAYGSENYNYESSCELWRIIGVFNTYSNEEDTIGEKRVKIVREQRLSKSMSWDITEDEIRYINQWGETTLTSDDKTLYAGASLMQYLNIGEESYYNSLSSIAKDQMNNALWYIGAISGGTAIQVYKYERSDTPGAATTVNKTTKWVGKIGLIYPSDFGYAGTNCGDYTINNYGAEDSCGKTSNWLTFVSDNYMYWTISPCRGYADFSMKINSTGSSNGARSDQHYIVRPSLYLKSSVITIDGNGTDDSPYVLDI